MTVLVDDHLLLAVLTQRQPPELDQLSADRRLFTTGLWYHRLCRALSAPRVAGSLSSRLGDLPPDGAGRVVSAATELPSWVGLVSLRDLAWPMAELLATHRLNLITLEAAAAAQSLAATIAIAEANDGPLLRAVAGALALPLRVLRL